MTNIELLLLMFLALTLILHGISNRRIEVLESIVYNLLTREQDKAKK